MTSNRMRIALIGTAAAAAAGFAAPASAQASRTFVSGVGNDADPCSRTAPCRTFAGAILKTAAGGEINCLDPGGYGGLTINKSLSIRCDYTEGGGLVAGAGVNGITINAAATDVVHLSGLDIFGFGTATNGIRFLVGAALHIQNSTIRRFNAASGTGILWAPSSASAELSVKDSIISDNGSGATGGGIVIDPAGNFSSKITLRNVDIVNNANVGLKVDVTASTGTGIFVSIEDSLVSGNVNGIHALHVAGQQGILITINDSQIVNNSGIGLLGDGASATMRVGDTTISGNATGVSRLNASQIVSYGDNRLNGNTAADGTFLLPNVGKL
jgi:hypothetical protein